MIGETMQGGVATETVNLQPIRQEAPAEHQTVTEWGAPLPVEQGETVFKGAAPTQTAAFAAPAQAVGSMSMVAPAQAVGSMSMVAPAQAIGTVSYAAPAPAPAAVSYNAQPWM